jgi:hypothetical protein
MATYGLVTAAVVYLGAWTQGLNLKAERTSPEINDLADANP